MWNSDWLADTFGLFWDRHLVSCFEGLDAVRDCRSRLPRGEDFLI
jgi:hypothetical protein